MSRIRVCFLGTPEFAVTCLDALLKDEHFEVVGVVTQPDRPAGRKLQLMPTPVKALAEAAGLKVLAPESLKQNQLMADEIRRWNAEVAVVVAFGQILTESFLQMFPLGCVNVHASLLPRWRGAAPIQRSIEAGDAETGVCLQKMVKKLDAGDVLGERRIALDSDTNSLELHDRLALLGAELLKIDLMDYVRGNLAAHAQDESLVTYAKKIEKTESAIRWDSPATDIHNRVRAFVWGPGSYAMLNGKRLKIHKTRVATAGGGRPGEVLEIGGTSFRVGCGGGSLEVLEIQPESRNRLSAAEFIKGGGIKTGEVLS